jgi:hypothetical protein
MTGEALVVTNRATDTIKAEILGYLFDHPNAMDTVSGIRLWWLECRQVPVGIDELSRTLAALVDSGVLEMVGSQHDPLYRLRKRTRQTRH